MLLNKPATSLHATRVPSMVKNYSRIFGDKDTELFSRLHRNITVVSFWMPAVRTLASTNRVLDHSVRFVYVCEVTQMLDLGSLGL